jgi:P4 family phage/plasmid primase-like protien
MDNKVKEMLFEHKVKGVSHTHVSMGKIKGRYQFNRKDLEIFWDEYSKIIKQNGYSDIGIAEKPQHYLPVMADIDIKVRESSSENDKKGMVVKEVLHSEKEILDVIKVYQNELKNILKNCKNEHLTCVVLEKPLYRITKNEITYAKHGFHLHFPFCFLNKIDQEVHLIPRVQKGIKDLETFKYLGIEDSGTVVDKACCSVPWLMYGSSKQEGLFPYKVSKVIDYNLDSVTLEKAFIGYDIFNKKEKKIDIIGKVESYLPRILSIIPYGRNVCEINSNCVSPLKLEMIRKEISRDFEKPSIKRQLSIASELLPMLSINRVTDYSEWMVVGWILYNIGEGCSEALDLWCSFSSRSEEDYEEAVCIYHWERMIIKDLTMGTLRYYASIDSPDLYEKFKKEQSKIYIKESIDGSHNDVAKVLFSEYGNEFICASIVNKIWFQFIGHKWEQIEEGVFLREKISGEIADRYQQMSTDILIQLSSNKDNAMEHVLNARLKLVNKMKGNLKSSNYKTSVMKECQEVFYDKRFREKLDMNPALFPFNNGIYDLVENIFRRGRPEDYISNSSPIDYIEMDEDDERVHDILEYLEKVFPDKSVKKYFTDISSDIFFGGNNLKHVYFLLGDGDNSKSILQGIFEKMLGRLSIKFNTSVITGKKIQSGGANPEMARAGGGVRLATLEEPNGDEMINIGILKNLSGNDTFYARDLFEKGKEGREITPMFKLFFICNKLPLLKHSDKAIWNRIRVIPFESTFYPNSKDVPESEEEQLKQKKFLMDPFFSRKIPGMVQAFAWYLLKHRSTVSDRQEPEKVRIATDIYRKDNDSYRQFIEECIFEDVTKSLSLSELYSQFREWFRESLPHHTVPIKNEVDEYFSKIWGESNRSKVWKGFRIRTIQDDIEDGDAFIMDDNDLIDYSINPL